MGKHGKEVEEMRKSGIFTMSKGTGEVLRGGENRKEKGKRRGK